MEETTSSRAKPLCVVVTGRPGAGKTTLAKLLGERLCLPVIVRDELKEGYVQTLGVPHCELPAETNSVVTDLFFNLVEAHLQGGISIVLEAAFQHPVWAMRMPRLLAASRPFVVLCTVDPEVAAQRHLERALTDPRREFFHGDALSAEFRHTGSMSAPGPYEEPRLEATTVRVSTADGYEPSLEELVRLVEAEFKVPGCRD